jgi:DNA-binding Lrp family transcriptional regulator
MLNCACRVVNLTRGAAFRRMIQITPKDEELLALLKVDAREPVASLARKLGVSRTTVQDRLRRLEETGVIAAYSIKLSREVDQGGMRAFMTMAVEPRRQIDVARALSRFAQIETLHTVSGKYDLVAQARAQSSEALDRLIDEIGQIPGINRIETAVILSTKLDRR